MSAQPEELSDDEDGFQNDFKNSRAKERDDDFDDFDDEFTASTANAAPAPGGQQGNPLSDSQVVQNRPYDEAVELDDDEESHPSPAPALDRKAAPGNTGRGAGLRESGKSGGEGGGDGVVKNKPFDEAVDLSSEESVDDGPNPQRRPAAHTGGRQADPPPRAGAEEASGDYGDEEEPRFAPPSAGRQGQQQGAHDEDDDDDDDDHVGAHREVNAGHNEGGSEPEIAAGMYNPAEYEGLNVSAEIKEMFEYIGRYKPHNIELETKMRPFIPDYIPAVGEIDPFVKIPRPDLAPDSLGLTVLDEPTSNQSDPVVMQLQLRAITKASSHAPVLVRSIEGADRDPKAIQSWIDSIRELHRNKPQPSVTYSKPMPDVEELMQIWPAEFEEMLDNVRLPSAEIDLPLREYAVLVCTLLDIPVHHNVMEPLHVLFSLFSDFKANVHFQQQFTAGPPGSGPALAAADQPGLVTGQGESLSFE